MRTELVEMTPEMAIRFLENNPLNRNVRPRVVDMYARDMSQGKWMLTGESIKVSAYLNEMADRVLCYPARDVARLAHRYIYHLVQDSCGIYPNQMLSQWELHARLRGWTHA